MAYKHGVYISEQPTGVVPPTRTAAGLPVVFGTAPINLGNVANVNKPVLCNTYADAVEALGYSSDWGKYTLCEFMKSHFSLFNVAPVVFVNVLDPSVHKTAVSSEAVTLVAGTKALASLGAIASTVVVKDATDTTTYILNTDYTLAFDADGYLVITRKGTTITATETLHVSYDKLNPTAVDADDIIGGVSGSGVLTGLELVNEVFPRFRLVPGMILAPKWSSTPSVAAVMTAKAQNINQHFKAIALTDIDTSSGGADVYSEASAWKTLNNYNSAFQAVCWPKVKLGTETYHLSTQLAGIMAKTDSENDDVPYVSPSNKSLQVDSSVVASGAEVWLAPDTAAYLNGEGIITALNFVGGWKLWGNRTGAYPANTDPKDSFLAIRRMFNWISNTIVLSFWQRVDAPLNRRLIETVVDSVNIWLNGLAARQYIIGGRVQFIPEENPTSDLSNGIAKFHVWVTPPGPAREIDFIVEYDPAYLSTLFGE